MFNYKLIVFLVSTLFIQSLYATENGDGSKGFQSVNESNKTVERIEVVGEQSRHFYLKEFRKHQEDFIASFNEQVDNKQMEVVCKLESFTGSNLRKRNCLPRFIATILAKETQWQASIVITQSSGIIAEASESIADNQTVANVSSRPVVRIKTIEEFKKFQALTVDLLNNNPALAATYIKMEDALEKYQNYHKGDKS